MRERNDVRPGEKKINWHDHVQSNVKLYFNSQATIFLNQSYFKIRNISRLLLIVCVLQYIYWWNFDKGGSGRRWRARVKRPDIVARVSENETTSSRCKWQILQFIVANWNSFVRNKLTWTPCHSYLSGRPIQMLPSSRINYTVCYVADLLGSMMQISTRVAVDIIARGLYSYVYSHSLTSIPLSYISSSGAPHLPSPLPSPRHTWEIYRNK